METKQTTAWGLRLCATIAALFALITLAARLYRLDVPLERDEGEYAYIAQMLLAGAPPFSEAYTMKLPGVPVWYALFFVLFGETIRAVHIAGWFVDVVSAVAIAILVRSLVDDARKRNVVAVVAASLFVGLASLLCFDGFTANCEKFVVVGVVGSLAVFVRDRGWRRLVGAGVLMGTAFVCKQQALPFLAALGLATLLRPHGEPVPIRRRLLDGVVVGVAMLVPFVVVVVAIAAGGTFDAFWFQTVTYAREYVNYTPHALRHLGNAFAQLSAEPLVVFAVVGTVAVACAGTFKPAARLLWALFFVASLAATSIGLYFRGHYFFFTVPFLAIAAATLSTWRVLLLVPMTVVLAASAHLHHADHWKKSDAKVNSDHYAQTTFVRAVPLANYLATISAPNDRVLIIGNEPEVLFMAKRRSVTPYIYFYPLLERQKLAPLQQQEVIDATAAANPDHIVVQIKTARALKGRQQPMRTWLPTLLAGYDVVWPPGVPKKLDAAALDRTKEPLLLLRRKGLPLPPSSKWSALKVPRAPRSPPPPAVEPADSSGRGRYPATTP